MRRRPRLPALAGLRAWIGEETRLANPALAAEVEGDRRPRPRAGAAWSEAVNRSISEIVVEVPPFPLVRESLESMAGKADVMVVSATPGEALEREWGEHGLFEHVALIAGQELGSKKEHLALAAGGRYEPEKILMVGDALGRLGGGARPTACSSTRLTRCRGRVVAAILRGSPAPILRRDITRANTWTPSSPGSSSCCPTGRRGNATDDGMRSDRCETGSVESSYAAVVQSGRRS